jgi:hypothetical protein
LARALAAKARKINRLLNVSVSPAEIARGEKKIEDADLKAAPARVDYDPRLFEEALLHLSFAIEHAPKRRISVSSSVFF